MWKYGFGKTLLRKGATGLSSHTAFLTIHGAIVSATHPATIASGFNTGSLRRMDFHPTTASAYGTARKAVYLAAYAKPAASPSGTSSARFGSAAQIWAR